MAHFVLLKIGQKGYFQEYKYELFSKKNNFVKCFIQVKIYNGNLILRTVVFEYLNNSLNFKSYLRFLEKNTLVPWYKDSSKPNVQRQL